MTSRKPVITLRLDADLRAAVVRRAGEMQLPVSAFIQGALRELLGVQRRYGVVSSVAAAPPAVAASAVPGRNAPCPCGSGLKVKQCREKGRCVK